MNILPDRVELRVDAPAVGVRATTASVQIKPQTSNTVILVPTQGPRGLPGEAASGVSVFNEVPDGVKDGINGVFTLTGAPRAGATSLYRNGLREHLGVGYTLSGSTITITTPPLSTDDITIDYLMEG